MAQEWNTRYPLVDGHGNFGSEDGDGPAAMRYYRGEIVQDPRWRCWRTSTKILQILEPNFDETERAGCSSIQIPRILLVNGTTGIAVGMATNIPPYNLREVIGAVVKIMDNRILEDRDTEIWKKWKS